jgi:hypothetical protein
MLIVYTNIEVNLKYLNVVVLVFVCLNPALKISKRKIFT